MTQECLGIGFGEGFGDSPWGGASESELRLIGALAVRENVVRIAFNNPVKFTGILDPGDGSGAEHYSVTSVGGVGLDSLSIRPVSVLQASLALEEGLYGTQIDLTVDRPFSHFPCIYRVSVVNLFSVDGFPLDACFASLQFYGVQQLFQQPKLDVVHTSRDFANPQTLSSVLDPLPNPLDQLLLGSIPVDESGDYAFDEGIPSIKKRVFRRLVTAKGAFLDKPNYGVGIPQVGKKLANRSTLDQLASEAQKQIGEEPDVQSVRVKYTLTSEEGLVRFIILIRTVAGKDTKFTAPFSIET